MRTTYMDVVKGIGIMLVIIGHNECPQPLHSWIFSFHMPLFFIISGYFWHYRPFLDELKNGLKHLIAPLWVTKVLWVILLIIAYNYTGLYTGPEIRDLIYGFLFEKGTFLMSVIWFIYALFWGRLMMNLIVTYMHRWLSVCAILLFVLPFTFKDFWISTFGVNFPFNILHGMMVPLFLVIGHSLKNWSFFDHKPFSHKLIFVCGLVMAYMMPIYMSGFSFPFLYWNIVSATIASVGFIFVCQLLSLYCATSVISAISFIGKNTLAILCIHAIEFSLQLHRFIPSFVPIYLHGIVMVFINIAILLIVRKVPLLRAIFNIK